MGGMKKKLGQPKVTQKSGHAEFLLYTAPNGKVSVEIFLHNETIWLTQKTLSEIFDCSVDNVSLHLKNIFDDGELFPEAVIEEFSITASDGKKYKTKHYNLDAIIAVGYRVNSKRATHFRMWATSILKEYMIKGFVMDDHRLKNPDATFGGDYFEDQLARIRDIRSSERRFYQKISDIYATAIDYDPNEECTRKFFATVQNKLHFAINGKTAAEIVHERVDSTKPHLGLTAWKHGPTGPIRKMDVIVAKNYLDHTELDGLNRIVTMYLDYAESQAKRGVAMHMRDWVEKLNAFLQFNEREILLDNGVVSHKIAAALAEEEFEKYRIVQDRLYESDFDKEMKKILDKKKK